MGLGEGLRGEGGYASDALLNAEYVPSGLTVRSLNLLS
jgi:hypothetical protein